MKITSVELLPASKYLFIKVHTDSGIYGTGEVGAWGYLDGCVGRTAALASSKRWRTT